MKSGKRKAESQHTTVPSPPRSGEKVVPARRDRMRGLDARRDADTSIRNAVPLKFRRFLLTLALSPVSTRAHMVSRLTRGEGTSREGTRKSIRRPVTACYRTCSLFSSSTSRWTISLLPMPSDSALKFVRTRCVSTG